MDDVPVRPAEERRRIARAEAAVWIVRLHGPHRTSELEVGFRHWLASHPDNALEFERVTAVWEGASYASIAGLPRAVRRDSSRQRNRLVLAGAAALLLACAASAWWVSQRRGEDRAYVTGIGEQRLIPLEDATRIALNSDSQVRIEFTPNTRRVRLIRGEALFEVAHDRRRPFVVMVGNHAVTALGTSFEVRYEADHIDVTLLEGKVTVTGAIKAEVTKEARSSQLREAAHSKSEDYTMSPGERLTMASGIPAKVDEPPIEAITAWRRGEVMLDDIPLADAVAEMNRYNKTPLVIDESRVSGLRISGIYHTGDSDGFAQTVATLYGLRVIERDNQIHLTSLGATVSPH